MPLYHSSPNKRRLSHRPISKASRLGVEALEDRQMMATLVWSNRGDDGFRAAFGAQENQARAVVDEALRDWSRTIVSFNSAENPSDVLPVTIRAAAMDRNLLGEGGGDRFDAHGKPLAGTVTLTNQQSAAGGSVFYVDPTPGDASEFENVLTPFAATRTAGNFDLYTVIAHELGHLVGFDSDRRSALARALNDTGIDDPDSTDPGNLWTVHLNGSPTPKYTFTAADPGHLWAGVNRPPATYGLPKHAHDLLNSGLTQQMGGRYLISDTDAQFLRDVYNYSVVMPSTFKTVHTQPSSTGLLQIIGLPDRNNNISISYDGEKIRAVVNGLVSNTASAGVTRINVIGGTKDDTFKIAGVPQNVYMEIRGADGWDTTNITSMAPGASVNFLAGAGQDTLTMTNPLYLHGNVNFNGGIDADYDRVRLSDGFFFGSTYRVTSASVETSLNPNFFFSYSRTDGLELNVSTEDTTVNVLSTSARTSVAWADRVNVGNEGLLDEIRGELIVSSCDYVYVDDSNGGAKTATINKNQIVGLATAPVTFWSPKNLEIVAGGWGNQFTINGPQTFMTLHSGAGNDRVDVASTLLATRINGWSGTDSVTLGNGLTSGLQGRVHVENHFGFTHLTVDDSADTAARQIAMNVVDDLGSIVGLTPEWAPLSYAADRMASVVLRTGREATVDVFDTMTRRDNERAFSAIVHQGFFPTNVNVYGTSSPLDLSLNAGWNRVTIGDLDDVQGEVTLLDGGGFNELAIEDFSASDHFATIHADRVQRAGSAPIAFRGLTNFSYASGDGVDFVSVDGNPTNERGLLSIRTGDNDDTIAIGAGNRLANLGNIIVDGGANRDSLVLLDSAQTAPQTYTLHEADRAIAAMGVIVGAHEVESIELRQGAGANRLALGGVIEGAELKVVGGAGGTIVGPDAGGVWTLSGAGAGRFSTSDKAGGVAFSAAIVQAGAGDDTFKILDGAKGVRVDGGGGSNTFDYSFRSAKVAVDLLNKKTPGVASADRVQNVIGTPFADVLQGDGFANFLDGRGGDDRLVGRDGDDVLDDALGNNRLEGGNGDDLLFTGAGNDVLLGGAGNDQLYSGAGFDELRGGAGNDTLVASTHAGQTSKLYGEAGNDWLYGGAGEDSLWGGGDHDSLLGGEGVDQLFGDAGADWLEGGFDGAFDSLTGGGGADVFVAYHWIDEFGDLGSSTERLLDFAAGDEFYRQFVSRPGV